MAVFLMAASASTAAERLADLMMAAKAVGEVPVFANDHVRVHYTMLEYPAAEQRVAESRPVVLYVQVDRAPGHEGAPRCT